MSFNALIPDKAANIVTAKGMTRIGARQCSNTGTSSEKNNGKDKELFSSHRWSQK